ncbi:MAG: hypothetical protein N2C14_07705, partial [Planctomycetales bacterium]
SRFNGAGRATQAGHPVRRLLSLWRDATRTGRRERQGVPQGNPDVAEELRQKILVECGWENTDVDVSKNAADNGAADNGAADNEAADNGAADNGAATEDSDF